MAGEEPSPSDQPARRRGQDRETESIPHARSEASLSEVYPARDDPTPAAAGQGEARQADSDVDEAPPSGGRHSAEPDFGRTGTFRSNLDPELTAETPPIVDPPLRPDPPLQPDPPPVVGRTGPVRADTADEPLVVERFVGTATAEAPPKFTEDEFGGLRATGAAAAAPAAGRMMPLRAEPSHLIEKYLFINEKFRNELRRHWIQLIKAFSIAGGATILAGYVAGMLTRYNQPGMVSWVVILWGATMAYVLWKVADWWFDRFILTNKRVMVIRGIFTRNVAMMPLLRVTDMKYVQSPWGRVLGYGHFELESAGQDQALRNIRNLPNPNELYLQIVEEMYEPEAVENRLSQGADDGT